MVLLGPVEGGPDGLSDEEAHRLDVIGLVAGESVVASLRKGHEVSLFDPDADPLVLLVADVKVAGSVQDVTDLLRVMDVLLKEGLDLFVVSRQEVGPDGNNVGVRITAWVGMKKNRETKQKEKKLSDSYRQ